jgi:hypothetical protein
MRVGVWERWHRGDDLETSQIGGDEAPPGDIDQFLRVGHAIYALIAGLVGGLIAIWFYARRERAGAAPGEARS